MSYFVVSDSEWIRVHVKKTLRHRKEDYALVSLLRGCAFRQMLEPPLWDGTYTILEGKKRHGAEERLADLGVEERKDPG